MTTTADRKETGQERSSDQLVATAERLAADFATRAGEHDRDASFPFENFELLREARLLNLTVSRAEGGEGAGLDTACRIIEAIGGGDASTALVLGMQYIHHAGQARSHTWPDEVRSQIVADSLRGVSLINSARVEPELGTPARGGLPATTGRRIEGGWLVSGHKMYTTGSPVLGYIAVFGRTDEDPARTGAFLVRAGSPGVLIEKTWNHFGLRATASDDLILEDVFVPEAFAIGLRGPGAPVAVDLDFVAWNALVVSSVYFGIAKAARTWISNYLNERKPSNLGSSLATLPRMQTAIGEMEALLFINERLLHGAAADFDAGLPVLAHEVNLVKSIVTGNNVRAVKMALDLVGNPGLSRNNPLERHYRDVMCGPVHTPQDDVVYGALGRVVLGQP